MKQVLVKIGDELFVDEIYEGLHVDEDAIWDLMEDMELDLIAENGMPSVLNAVAGDWDVCDIQACYG